MGNWVDPRNPKGRRRKTTDVGEGKEFHVKKGESLKEEGYPHSTSPSSQPKQKDGTQATLKKAFDKQRVMAERRAAAQAAGKGNWTKEGAMAERKAAAKAQGKGNWNAQEEMEKRRKASQMKKQNNYDISAPKKR